MKLLLCQEMFFLLFSIAVMTGKSPFYLTYINNHSKSQHQCLLGAMAIKVITEYSYSYKAIRIKKKLLFVQV